MKKISLPYTDDITPIFSTIASYPWSIWLDSGNANIYKQRYDIISGFPYKTLYSTLDELTVKTLDYDNQLNSSYIKLKKYNPREHNPFDIIDSFLAEIKDKTIDEQIPFHSGAMGLFGYDLNQLMVKQLKSNKSNNSLPVLAVGFYSWSLSYDHKDKKAYFSYDEDLSDLNIISTILELLSNTENKSSLLLSKKDSHTINYLINSHGFKPKISKKQYDQAYQKIKNHIHAGDCYQINYAVPFELMLPRKISSWKVYQYLRQYNSKPFCAYFNINNNITVLSFSPERFIKLNNSEVTAQPIKGTRPNIHSDCQQNSKNIEELQNHPKDRAENIMITDLLRNDLNKYCIPGTVKTTEICKLVSFPSVHHLVTTIKGKLSDDHSATELLKGCFPGGSITGAPKIKAMEIISKLENSDGKIIRYAYCGSIGYINSNQNMDMSITIRTILNHKELYYYLAGSGIVADSDNNEEFNEVYAKLLKTC